METTFKQRTLEFKSKQAIELIGKAISSEHLKLLTKKDRQEKSSYHMKYSPAEIRQAREELFPAEFRALANRKRPAVICVHTSKGGTGKTTTSVNLAVALAAQGYRVCLIDADPQASASTLLGFASEDPSRKTLRDLMSPALASHIPLAAAAISIYSNAYLDFIPADLSMGRLERELASDRFRDMKFSQYFVENEQAFSKYEFVIIDTNPSSTTLNFNMMVPANLIIAVAKLDGLSLTALNSLAADLNDIQQLTQVYPKLLLVANEFHPTLKHVQENLRRLREEYGDFMADTLIPQYAGFGRQVRLGEDEVAKPLYESEPTSAAAHTLLALSREVSRMFTAAAANDTQTRAASSVA